MLAIEAAALAAVTAFNNPLVTFLPVATAQIPLITGTGTDASTTGTGNADAYVSTPAAPHLNVKGLDHTVEFLTNGVVSVAGVV